MLPPGWFLALDVLFQFTTTVIAVGVAAFAYRGFRWMGERTFLFLSLAFCLLAAGFFINGLTLGYAIVVKLTFARAQAPFFIADIGLWAYYILQIAAYSVLVYAYTRKLRSVPTAAAVLGGTLFLFGPIAEIIIVILLFVIVLAQIVHYSARKSRNSLIVIGSFLFLLMGNLLILFSTFDSFVYVLGKVLQMVAFFSLVLLLYRLRGID